MEFTNVNEYIALRKDTLRLYDKIISDFNIAFRIIAESGTDACTNDTLNAAYAIINDLRIEYSIIDITSALTRLNNHTDEYVAAVDVNYDYLMYYKTILGNIIDIAEEQIAKVQIAKVQNQI